MFLGVPAVLLDGEVANWVIAAAAPCFVVLLFFR
jgi:hypothetical protein